jgi:hypothetical protein
MSTNFQAQSYLLKPFDLSNYGKKMHYKNIRAGIIDSRQWVCIDTQVSEAKQRKHWAGSLFSSKLPAFSSFQSPFERHVKPSHPYSKTEPTYTPYDCLFI